VDTFGSTYAKAIDDLSTKIFIPAIICSLISEFGEFFVQHLGLIWGYVAVFVLGIVIGVLVVGCIVCTEHLFGYNAQIKPYLGTFLMPLGSCLGSANGLSRIVCPAPHRAKSSQYTNTCRSI